MVHGVEVAVQVEAPGHGQCVLWQQLRRRSNTVHPIIRDRVVLVAPAHHVVEVAVPDKLPGAEAVPVAVVARLALFAGVVREVLEDDLPPLGNGRIDRVDDAHDLAVGALDAPLHGDVADHARGRVLPGKGAYLLDNFPALALGNEPGGGHRVDHHAQLGVAEEAVQHVVFVLGGLGELDVHAEALQQLDVRADGGPVGGHAEFLLKDLRQLRRGEAVLRIGALVQDFRQDEGAKLCVVVHGVNSYRELE